MAGPAVVPPVIPHPTPTLQACARRTCVIDNLSSEPNTARLIDREAASPPRWPHLL